MNRLSNCNFQYVLSLHEDIVSNEGFQGMDAWTVRSYGRRRALHCTLNGILTQVWPKQKLTFLVLVTPSLNFTQCFYGINQLP